MAVAKITTPVRDSSVAWVPISLLNVDRRWQRPLNENFVAEIAAGYDDALVGILMVADLGNGTFNVFDGQHRLEASKLMGHDEVECKIHHGMSIRRQAEIFVRSQTQRKHVHACDQHRAAVFFGDPDAVALDAIVNGCGFRIANASRVYGCIACPDALAKSVERYGADSLRKALNFISETWSRQDHAGRKKAMILGLSLLINKYPELDLDALSNKVREVPTSRILREAAALADVGIGGTNTYSFVAVALLVHYNKGRQAGNKISQKRLGRA